MATITGPKGLVKAACWYAEFLGIANEDFTLHIERKPLGAVRAFCLFDPDEMDGYIEINPASAMGHDIYTTLAHEMVHVKQYVRRQLVDTGPITYWNGEPYIDASNSPDDDKYWSFPWEIEAYGRERGMNYMRIKAFAKET